MTEREATDELFRASLDAFVETRARLAAALAEAGSKAEGQALKKIRRPSPSAWATNQVVRRARAELDAFLEASDRLRASQGAIIAGRGDRGVFQADTEELRRATAALAEAARRLLTELGRPDDRAVVERVLANGRAAALTEAARAALLAGALVADLDGGGDAFGGLLAAGAALAPPGPPARPTAPTGPPARPTAPRAAVALVATPRAPDEDARRREQEARARELADATRDETSARDALASAEAASTRARAALADARARAEAAHEAAREAERAVRDAEAALRCAQREAAEAETRAGRATRRREVLQKK
jgi:hypothetical protein